MILFREHRPGMFDLTVDGRAVVYDVEPDDFAASIRRARVSTGDHKVYVEDLSGYREPLGR